MKRCEDIAVAVANAFLKKYNQSAAQISAEACLQRLLTQMERGLAGEGLIPMLPSYLSTDICVVPGERCWVLDAGGTNLRSASACFDESGKCRIEDLRVVPMPGTQGELSKQAFYAQIASQLLSRPVADRVGFCFSYNVDMDRDLDGKLLAWCKEVRVPEAIGERVGEALREALGGQARSVHILNDSTAAMLGADRADVALILGTGINLCYGELCENIPKVPNDLKGKRMIISTEVGEFDGIPEGDFDARVIESSDIPAQAHGEKQCAGAYLGGIIRLAWRTAADEKILPKQFGNWTGSLSDVSQYLAGTAIEDVPDDETARYIAAGLVHRAAKIAAILTAGPVIRSSVKERPARIAVEGSTFWKLTGFQDHFCGELTELLCPYGIRFELVRTENACLIGAALSAFAETM